MGLLRTFGFTVWRIGTDGTGKGERCSVLQVKIAGVKEGDVTCWSVPNLPASQLPEEFHVPHKHVSCKRSAQPP